MGPLFRLLQVTGSIFCAQNYIVSQIVPKVPTIYDHVTYDATDMNTISISCCPSVTIKGLLEGTVTLSCLLYEK